MADSSKKQTIGDPLAEAAQSGMLGGRRPITSRQEPETPPSAPAPVALEPTVQTQQPQAGVSTLETGKSATRRTKREREKKTILFEPQRAKWLEIQAATERREMSDIVSEALALYERLYVEKKTG
ncbi:MAG: hypothetical protein ABI413_11430 [Ktedonobacteraceae bacterium]